MVTEKTVCPACCESSSHFLDWQYSGLDASIFNYTARFYHCPDCGLVYIENINDKRLALFYADECSYSEKAHFDITSPANIAKYSCYRDVMSEHGLENAQVTDIGCGRGGFLLWLNTNGWQADCFGVDVDIKSMPVTYTEKKDESYGVLFQQGGALSLPFADNSQQLLTYFHVFEHIRDMDAVLSNAQRVLMPDGHILIEVPDAERYPEQPIGSAFWLGIREHIYHFSAQALIAALNRHGFDIVCVRRDTLPTPEFNYPSLMILAKKGEVTSTPTYLPGNDIAAFSVSSQQALSTQAEQIVSLAQHHSALTFWGCSAELFSLLPLLDGLEFVLCDASEQKQQSHYKSRPIHDPSQVKPEGVLIIAPYLHADSIEQAAMRLGWPQHLIYRLT